MLNLENDLADYNNVVWRNASIRICADGGANRLYEYDKNLIPNYIIGDLDSIRDDVKNYYQAKGTTVVKEEEQDTNDLSKCLRYISSLNIKFDKILITGGLGGRFDHEMANFNVLYCYSKYPIWIVSRHSVVILLRSGHKHRIRWNKKVEDNICGLIPLGQPCTKCWTTGLKWNLDGTAIQFGGLISTSNEIVNDIVEIEATNDILWTCSLLKKITLI